MKGDGYGTHSTELLPRQTRRAYATVRQGSGRDIPELRVETCKPYPGGFRYGALGLYLVRSSGTMQVNEIEFS